MNNKNNFIPRHGSPLFYPQDPSEGFQGASGGFSRRKFLKRTGGSSIAAVLASSAASREARGVVNGIDPGSVPYAGKWEIKPDAFGPSTYDQTNGFGGNPKSVMPGTAETITVSGNQWIVRSYFILYVAQDVDNTATLNHFASSATNAVAIALKQIVQYKDGNEWKTAPPNVTNQYRPELVDLDYFGSMTKTINFSTGVTTTTVTPANGGIGAEGEDDEDLRVVWNEDIADITVHHQDAGDPEVQTLDLPFTTRFTPY